MSSLSERFLAYLGSSKNLAGCAVFALGLFLFASGVTGDFGLLVAAIGYLLAALLVPYPKAHLSLPSRDTDEIVALRRDVGSLRRQIAQTGSRLPREVHARLGRIFGVLETILSSADRLSTSPEQMFIVSRTIRDYLPTSLEVYLNLPPAYAMRASGSRRSALEELSAQLELLEAQMEKVATTLYEGNLQALVNQGRFLEEKFRSSSLDLT